MINAPMPNAQWKSNLTDSDFILAAKIDQLPTD